MRTPAGSGSKMKWIEFTDEWSKEESVLYKVTYYQHLEPAAFHSQNGWYFLEAWIVLQVSHLLKYQKEDCEGCQRCFIYYDAPCRNEWKILEEQFEPTGWLLLSNEPWACFSSYKCLLNKISWGLMVYGEVEYTYRYKHFCINIRRILLWKSCFVQ